MFCLNHKHCMKRTIINTLSWSVWFNLNQTDSSLMGLITTASCSDGAQAERGFLTPFVMLPKKGVTTQAASCLLHTQLLLQTRRRRGVLKAQTLARIDIAEGLLGH